MKFNDGKNGDGITSFGKIMLVKDNNENVTSDRWQTSALGKKCANSDEDTLIATGHTVLLSSDLSDSDSEDDVDHVDVKLKEDREDDQSCRSLKRPVFVVEEPDEIEDHSEKTLQKTLEGKRSKWRQHIFKDGMLSRKMVESSQLFSKNAKRAILDFHMHLQILDVDHLDEEGFRHLLDSMGYKRDQKGLFESLVMDVCDAHALPKGLIDTTEFQVTIEDMCAIYAWEPYALLDHDIGNAGDRLLKFVDEVMDYVDSKESNGFLSAFEISQLTKALLGRETVSEEELEEVQKALDINGNGLISRRDFKATLLKLEQQKRGENSHHEHLKSADTEKKPYFAGQLPFGINHFSLEPAHTPPHVFVTDLETFALNHNATNHPFLQSLAAAYFGKRKTADYLLRFISAYSKVNKGFIPNVTKLISLFDNPKHKDILEENLEEEMGIYDEETLKVIEQQFGVNRDVIVNKTHGELFQNLLSTLEQKMRVSYRDFIPDDVVKPYLDAMKDVGIDQIGLSASLYFGSEIIVPKFYSYVLQGLQKSMNISDEDAIFFILHIDMDADHADHMREMIVDFSDTYENRLKLVKATDAILRARVSFYDALVREIDSQQLYGVEEPNGGCDLSEAGEYKGANMETGHPIMKMLTKNLGSGVFHHSTVLEVGCGEDGLLSRFALNMGAQKVVCVDQNQGSIERSRINSVPGQYFLRGDMSNCSAVLEANYSEINMMPGYQFATGMFDLSYSDRIMDTMSLHEMQSTFFGVFKALKPDGHFVFTVSNTFTGATTNQNHLCTHLKTFQDYTSALKSAGFSIVDILETRSSRGEELLVYHTCKPQTIAKGNLGSASSLDVMPKHLVWNRIMKQNFLKFVTMTIPDSVNRELCDVTFQCFCQGLRVDDIVLGKHVRPNDFENLRRFCDDMRHRIMHESGAVLVNGLDLNNICGKENVEMLTECSRISYYILSSFLGKVDGGARGRLFDVKNANINALDKLKGDNVLFSVSDSECSWHTDGASIDRVYDIVGLMCIFPASEGGEFSVSNACNAYEELSKKIPNFINYELQRPVPRDILENGKGKGVHDIASALSRSRDVLAMRIRYNSYPIYNVDSDRIRFRYMRHWIETGHEKTKWRVPTLLRISMDLLDDQLNEECCFNQRLNSGEIIFANNSILAHARSSFKDNEKDGPARHLLRAWIQVQKMRSDG